MTLSHSPRFGLGWTAGLLALFTAGPCLGADAPPTPSQVDVFASGTPGVGQVANLPHVMHRDVFASGTQGYHTYRIPAIVLSNQGTLLAFCEGRKTSASDAGDIDLVLRRSMDGGKNWARMQLVYEEGGTAKITIGNPCPVVDRQTGTIWLPFCRNNDRVFITKSTDDGQTWAPPVEITKDVKKPDWEWYATGPGHGIQLSTGRLLIPCDHRLRGKSGGEKVAGHSHVFYSDDRGETWKLGGVTESGMNECQAVELADGSILLSMRQYLGPKQRAFATSRDGGLSWSKPALHPHVYCPVCQSSIQRLSLAPSGKNRIVYSGPGGPGRTSMTIRLSDDEGRAGHHPEDGRAGWSWPVARVLQSGPAAYSDLVVLPDGSIGCLYERGEKRAYEKITFARFTVGWLESD